MADILHTLTVCPITVNVVYVWSVFCDNIISSLCDEQFHMQLCAFTGNTK